MQNQRRLSPAEASVAPTIARFYPIGTPGQPWGAAEKAAWLARSSTIKRSYHEEVILKLQALAPRFDIEQYGALSYDPQRYPLFAVKTRGFHDDPRKPTLLVTGGVHGYETSGVQGALLFLDKAAESYSEHFNIVVLPCVSPWGYETINRWNPNAVDPNRSFHVDSSAEECAAVLAYVESLGVPILVHVDLHETTDTDESEFRPAKAARDGTPFEPDSIPDGFYLVGCAYRIITAAHGREARRAL